jgi:hypothetical protein
MGGRFSRDGEDRAQGYNPNRRKSFTSSELIFFGSFVERECSSGQSHGHNS